MKTLLLFSMLILSGCEIKLNATKAMSFEADLICQKNGGYKSYNHTTIYCEDGAIFNAPRIDSNGKPY